MKNIFTALIVMIAMAFTSCSSNAQTNSGTANVSAEEFKALIDKNDSVQILDVRTADEWQTGIIPNALKNDWFGANFVEGLKTLDKEAPVLVYCAAGGRSSKAMQKLSALGFKKVYNLSGGMGAWKSKGYAVE